MNIDFWSVIWRVWWYEQLILDLEEGYVLVIRVSHVHACRERFSNLKRTLSAEVHSKLL